jgi:hypothetical protein
MKRLALGAALFLAGCTTTTIREMREDTPRATYESSRSVPALEQCLAGNLSWLAQPSIVHGEATSELSFGSAFGGTGLLVTLRPLSAGARVEVREGITYGTRVRTQRRGLRQRAGRLSRQSATLR